MAVISHPHLAHQGEGLSRIMRGILYVAMAVAAIAVAVPAAIATVG
ncbi:MAG: hypothetical protein AAB227_05430 [Pseudomonadota bacterium]